MKKAIFSLALLGLVALGSQAGAVICTVDDVPAATLLLPYFEVDGSHADGITTLFSVNNASATAILAHVTVWTDLSVPVLDFNIYLTGYDVQSVNLRDVLLNGVLPQTASAGQDPGDAISHKGIFSQDINFASCTGQLPLPAVLPLDFRNYLRNALTGTPQTSKFIHCSSNPCCAAQDIGDNILRGYVTIDTVNNCTLKFPNVESYWVNDATFQNVLWGDAIFVNSAQNFASGNPLVHIEASTTNPETSGPASGNYTFAGRYVNWTTEDHREPLATNFAVRFINGGAFSGGTNLHVWRDSKFNQGAFHCADFSEVPWYPLGQEGIVIFDEQENPVVPTPTPISPPGTTDTLTPFPAETQSVQVGGSTFPVPFAFGWLYLDLNTVVPASGCTAGCPPEDPAAAQAWVEVQMNAEGRYEVGYSAIKLDSACVANHVVPGG